MTTIDATLINAYIRQARLVAADTTDACTIEKLTEWQTTALSNFQSGITVTSVSFAGQGTSGERDVESEQLLRICELAIGKLSGERQTASASIRYTGCSAT